MSEKMLYQKEYISIGYIRKAHGFSGLLSIELEPIFFKDLQATKFLFLEIDGYKVPFRVTQLHEKKGLLIKLAHINSPEDLQKYKHRELFLLKEDVKFALEALEQEELLSGLSGFAIQDQYTGKSGIIDRIEEYPQQLMAIAIVDNQEVLIPLVENFIIDIDESKKLIIMDLPEGLI